TRRQPRNRSNAAPLAGLPSRRNRCAYRSLPGGAQKSGLGLVEWEAGADEVGEGVAPVMVREEAHGRGQVARGVVVDAGDGEGRGGGRAWGGGGGPAAGGAPARPRRGPRPTRTGQSPASTAAGAPLISRTASAPRPSVAARAALRRSSAVASAGSRCVAPKR